MRRLAVSTFAFLYAGLILSGSAEKAFVWAEKQSESFSHHDSRHSAHAFRKTERSDSHLGQTKITETESLVESPRKTDATPLLTSRRALQSIADAPLSRTTFEVSSRAPPFLS
jgi:hypothetical protein